MATTKDADKGKAKRRVKKNVATGVSTSTRPSTTRSSPSPTSTATRSRGPRRVCVVSRARASRRRSPLSWRPTTRRARLTGVDLTLAADDHGLDAGRRAQARSRATSRSPRRPKSPAPRIFRGLPGASKSPASHRASVISTSAAPVCLRTSGTLASPVRPSTLATGIGVQALRPGFGGGFPDPLAARNPDATKISWAISPRTR